MLTPRDQSDLLAVKSVGSKIPLLCLFAIACLSEISFCQDGTRAAVQHNERASPAASRAIYVNGSEYAYTESGLATAISSAGASEAVWVPRGSIRTNSTLSISSDVRIYWDGVTLESTKYNGDIVLVQNARNVSFAGKLIIDGRDSGTGSTSYGLDLVDVQNFTFEDLEVKNTLNGCVQILGSSHIRGSKIYATNCGRASSTSAGVFGAGNDDSSLTDVEIDEIDVDTTHESDCVYFSGTAGKPSLRINIAKVDMQGCGDTGLELNHTRQANIGQVTVGEKAALNSGVLIRETTDDNISSVTCAGGIKVCVDVATFSDSDSAVDRIVLGQIIATGVSADDEDGAAVRIWSNRYAPISNVIFDSIIASGSTRGFYCRGASAGGGQVQHVIVNNLIAYAAAREGVYINGCSDVLLQNIIAYNNGQSYPGSAGIRGSSATDVVLGTVRVFDDQARKTQGYGILTDGRSDRWTIGNADARDDLEVKSGLSLTGSNNIVFRRVGPTGAVQILGKPSSQR
jgi:hypothetical protein